MSAGIGARRRREVDLAVLVNGFPRLSETFVLQELLDLERRGVRLIVFALSDPREPVGQDALGHLQARVEYVPEKTLLTRSQVLRAHAAVAANRRFSYARALGELASSPDWRRSTERRAVMLARRLVELGSPPLYVHFAHKPGTIGRFAARLAGVPYALSCHAKDIWSTPPDELRRKLRDAEIVLTCTRAGRDELQRHAAEATPVLLAYHGVDVESTAPRRPVDGPPRILTVGRLVEKKGHDTLIRAAGLLRDRGVEFVLRIAGDGVEWPRLQRLVHELDLAGHVLFLGPLSPSELRPEWGSATVFALGCRQLANGDRDGLPNVLMEAMVQGLPVVAASQPGVAEAVVHGHTGLLVESNSPAALANALEQVLGDPALAVRFGEAGRSVVRERFDQRLLLPVVSHALARAGLIAPSADPALSPVIAMPAREAA